MKLDSLEGMTVLQMLILLNMLSTAMALTRPARKTTPMNHRETRQETLLSKGACRSVGLLSVCCLFCRRE